jgi:hypothetical protein
MPVSLSLEVDLSGSEWMCVLCGQDLCLDEKKQAQTKLILRGGLSVYEGLLGLSAIGPDGKIKPLATSAPNYLFDVLQNAGWIPPTPRKPVTDSTFTMAFSQVSDTPFWKGVCAGPHKSDSALVAVLTDGKTLGVTVDGSFVGKRVEITEDYMSQFGWKKGGPPEQASGLLDSPNTVLGLALGGSTVLLAFIVLLCVFLHKKCKASSE